MHLSLTQKVGLIVGAAWAVGAASSIFLTFRLDATGGAYQHLLSEEVAQSSAARVMQVTFKKQVQEWKDVLLRGSDPASLQKYREAFEARAKDVDDQTAVLRGAVTNPQVTRLLEEFARAHESMDAVYRSALGNFAASGGTKPAEADQSVKGQDRAPTDLIDQVVGILSRDTQAKIAAQRKLEDRDRWIILLLLGISFVGSATLAVYSVGRIDKIFRVTLHDLVQGTAQISSAARQAASASQSLARGAADQAASIEETSAASNEMNAMTERNAENARLSAELMLAMDAVVAEANGGLREMEASMQEIDASSLKIRGILQGIEEIAFQTNILALNAAVEAARAGATGAGFAVVADEVRNLAARSASSAHNTAALIEDSIQRASEGSKNLGRLGAAVHSITGKVGTVQSLIHEISAGCAEQVKGVQQVSGALAQMTQVTQQSAASSQQTAAVAQELSAQAESMRVSVSRLE